MEALVGALRAALAGKHARGVFALAFEREDPGGIGEFPRHILPQRPAQDLAPVLELRQGHPRHPGMAQAFGMGFHPDLLAAHEVDVLVAGVVLFLLFPALQHAEAVAVQVFLQVLVGGFEPDGLFGIHHFHSSLQGKKAAGDIALLIDPPVVMPVGFADLRQVARAPGRDDIDLFRLLGGKAEIGMQAGARPFADQVDDMAVEPVDAGVVELAGDTPEDGHFVHGHIPGVAVALHLLAYVPQGVQGPPFVKFIEGDHIGKVEHVDLFELGGRPVFRRHHVEAHIRVVDDLGVALADAAGFEDDQVEGRCFEDIHGRVDVLRQGQVALAGSQRAHIHPGRIDGVHPDAVAEQGAARFALGRVDGNDGDGLVLKVHDEAPHQFVHQRRFAGAARTRNAQHRGYFLVFFQFLADGRQDLDVKQGRVVLRDGDQAADGAGIVPRKCLEFAVQVVAFREIALFQHVVDHALEAHAPPVVRVVDPGDAVLLEFFDLFGQDGAPAAAEEFDIGRAAFAQQVVHVLEEFHMPPLIGGDGDALDVFLNGAVYDLSDGPVVPEVNDLGARALHDAPHDVDGGVVPVEERGRRDDADLVFWLEGSDFFHGFGLAVETTLVVVRAMMGNLEGCCCKDTGFPGGGWGNRVA